MRRILDTSRPVGGMWTYTQPETGVVFSAWSYPALLTRISAHRGACNIPMSGGWTAEVQEAMIAANPDIPHEEIGAVKRFYNADDVHRFISTMMEMRGGEKLVSPEEQARRIDICAACPKKGVIGCKWCGWLASKVTEIMGGRKIHRAPEVFKHSCMACGCDIPSKTAISLDLLKKVDEKLGESPDYAEGCWMTEV